VLTPSGKGLFWGVEFVLDKTTKEPFPASTPVADLIVEAAIEGGLVVYPGMKGAADGFLGDHIMVCPPYTISKEEIHWLVDTLVQSIKAVLS
jgi:adenosylmethionine-8-amino-7-oxononanoate aminotransferase